MTAIPDRAIHCVVTSPPYFGLREYATAQWEGGDANCSHRREKLGENSTLQGRKVGSQGVELSKAGCVRCGAMRADEQIGLEATVAEYVDRLVAVFREVRRVLRDDGVVFLNLGDSYAGSWGAQGRGVEPASEFGDSSMLSDRSVAAHPKRRYTGSIRDEGLKPKDLIGVPWRVAFALQSDGWWLRDAIIWHKPATMPSSVEDRCTPSYEFVFMLAKRSTYFVDMDAVRQSATSASVARLTQPGLSTQMCSTRANAGGKSNGPMKAVAGRVKTADDPNARGLRQAPEPGEPNAFSVMPDGSLGANLRNVWTIATEPVTLARYECTSGHEFVLPKRMSEEAERAFRCRDCGEPVSRDEHFAAFPSALAARCIRMGTSEAGCCSECGAPYRRVIDVDSNRGDVAPSGTVTGQGVPPRNHSRDISATNGQTLRVERTTLGFEPSCKCTGGGISPCVVLDIFMGTGTTAEVAEGLGRRWVGYELSPAYHSLIAERTKQIGLFSGGAA